MDQGKLAITQAWFKYVVRLRGHSNCVPVGETARLGRSSWAWQQINAQRTEERLRGIRFRGIISKLIRRVIYSHKLPVLVHRARIVEQTYNPKSTKTV